MGFLDDLLKNLTGQSPKQVPNPQRSPMQVATNRPSGRLEATHSGVPYTTQTRPADFDLGERLLRSGVKPAKVIDRRFSPWQISRLPERIKNENPQNDLEGRGRMLQGMVNNFGNGIGVQVPETRQGVQQVRWGRKVPNVNRYVDDGRLGMGHALSPNFDVSLDERSGRVLIPIGSPRKFRL